MELDIFFHFFYDRYSILCYLNHELLFIFKSNNSNTRKGAIPFCSLHFVFTIDNTIQIVLEEEYHDKDEYEEEMRTDEGCCKIDNKNYF